MAELAGNQLERHAGVADPGGVGVAQPVKADPPGPAVALGRGVELSPHGGAGPFAAVGAPDQPVVLVPVGPERLQEPPAGRGQDDGAARTALGRRHDELAGRCDEVAAAQAGQFAEPASGVECGVDQTPQVRRSVAAKHLDRLGGDRLRRRGLGVPEVADPAPFGVRVDPAVDEGEGEGGAQQCELAVEGGLAPAHPLERMEVLVAPGLRGLGKRRRQPARDVFCPEIAQRNSAEMTGDPLRHVELVPRRAARGRMAAEIVVEGVGNRVGPAVRRDVQEPESRFGPVFRNGGCGLIFEPAPGQPGRVPVRQEAVGAESFLAVAAAVLQAEAGVPFKRTPGPGADREAEGAAAAERHPVGRRAGRQRGDLPGIGEIDRGRARAPAARSRRGLSFRHSEESVSGMREGQFDIADRAVRRELAARPDPYWLTFARHRSIGFAKRRAWTWHARFQWPDSARRRKIIGVAADSPHDCPGLERLTFDQAMGRVKLWCAEAEAAGRDWQRHRHPPLAPPETGVAYTVRHAFWDWLEWRRRAGLPLHPYRTTYRRYLGPEIGSLPLAQLEQRDLVRWRDRIAATPAWDSAVRFPHISEVETGSGLFEAIRRRRKTADNHLVALKNALDHAHLHGLIDSSIGWRGVRLLPHLGRYRPPVFEPEEVEMLIGALDRPVRHLVEAVWHSGARIGEIVGLTPERVLADHCKIVVIDTKKRTARGVALTRRGAEFFAGQVDGKAHGDLLFRNPLGAPWTVQRAGNQLRRELHRIRWPEPVTFRALRSSYASFLIAGGVPPAVVARQLGHTSSVTTELYYGHISESAVDAMIRQKIDRADLVPVS
ncbi:MAG: tyrosine-type recombinase/integrase [Rhodospirillaceae bacterium]|nr:tyrosine-type recombinase/integrase [Rhodospirillaceae bacterium]